MGPSWRAELRPHLLSLSPSAWNSLLEPDDQPLLSWEFLEALERTGCVGEGTNWHPMHILLWRSQPERASASDNLVAAAPCYLKHDSDGEWVFDLDWAMFAESLGRAYFPKLVVSVPFSPVTGGRLLISAQLTQEERREVRQALLQALRQVVQAAGLSSAHVLFPRMDDGLATELRDQGFLLRRQEQYHFLNKNYGGFDDFLGQLRGHRRTSIRRERRALYNAGVRVCTYRGLDLQGGFDQTQLDAMFDMYHATSVRYTGGAPYLNRAFFQLCAERLGNRLELVLAHGPDGKLMAGAWNLRGDTRLFGRYWGVAPDSDVPFLHFEVCYYHSIERCIAEGMRVFEPGHGGEHKLLRGFTPVYTHSAHYLRESALRQPIAMFLRDETRWVHASFAAASLRCPIRLPKEQQDDRSQPDVHLPRSGDSPWELDPGISQSVGKKTEGA
ncbi:MAG: GNAT family N-acetyltransferase [Myxococcales bacterium]|nr:GNAT family N-acetyltransferase [Myxococcales bacterium]